MSIKTSQVTNCIKFFVQLTGEFDIDSDKYVISRNGERFTLNDGDEQKELILYQEEIRDKDALIVNPFAEGLGATKVSSWFFKSQIIGLTWRMSELYRSIIQLAVIEKSKRAAKIKAEDKHLPMELLGVISSIIDDVDDKVLKEFELIYESSNNVSNNWIDAFYQKRHMRTIFKCLFIGDNPEWRKQFDIRKKSWTIFENITKKLFDIEDANDLDNKYASKAGTSCVRFATLAHTLFKVYSAINIVLDQINSELTVNLGIFNEHLENFEAYSNNAKFMVQPTSSKSSCNQVPGHQQYMGVPRTNVTHNGVPIGGVPMPQHYESQVPQPEGTIVPGPARTDGTLRNVTMVPRAHVPVPGPSGMPMYGGTPFTPPMTMQQPPYGAPPGYNPYGQPQGYNPYGAPQMDMPWNSSPGGYQPNNPWQGQPQQPQWPVNQPYGMNVPGSPPNFRY